MDHPPKKSKKSHKATGPRHEDKTASKPNRTPHIHHSNPFRFHLPYLITITPHLYILIPASALILLLFHLDVLSLPPAIILLLSFLTSVRSHIIPPAPLLASPCIPPFFRFPFPSPSPFTLIPIPQPIVIDTPSPTGLSPPQNLHIRLNCLTVFP